MRVRMKHAGAEEASPEQSAEVQRAGRKEAAARCDQLGTEHGRKCLRLPGDRAILSVGRPPQPCREGSAS